MYKIIKTILVTIIAILLSTVLLLFLVGIIWGDKISDYLITNLNNNLTAKVEVKSVHFSFIKRFPNASIEFGDVVVHAPKEFSFPPKDSLKTDLLRTKYILLKFNLLGLIKKNVTLNEITVDGATIQFIKNINGVANYNIFKKDTTTGYFKFDLKKIRVKNSAILYSNMQSKVFVVSNIRDFVASGNFLSGSMICKLDFDGNVSELTYKNDIILKNSDLIFISKVKDEENKINFDAKNFEIKGFCLSFNGYYNKGNKEVFFSYIIKKQQVEKLITILKPVNKTLASIIAKGNITSTGNITWNQNLHFPLIRSKVELSKSFFSYKNYSFKNINSDFEIVNASTSGNDFKIEIKRFEAVYDSITFSATANIKNINKPFINSKLYYNGPAKVLHTFTSDNFIPVKGDVTLTLAYKGYLTNDSINRPKLSGTATLNDVSAIINKSTTLSNANGEVNFDNDLIFNNIKFEYKTSTLKVNGKFIDFFKPDIDTKRYSFEGDIFCDYLTNSDTVKKDGSFLSIPENFDVNATFNVNKLLIKKHVIENISGKVIKNGNQIDLPEIQCNYLNGNLNASNTHIEIFKSFYSVSGNVKFSKIDITKLFDVYNNFDQDKLTSRNIAGKINGKFYVYCEISNSLNINYDKLKLDGNFEITKGQLTDFEPLNKLSKFIDIEELKNVKFSTIKNTLTINNKTLVFPQMEIISSACDFNVFGKHYFDNNYEYHIKISFSEYMRKKYQKTIDKNNEFANVVPDEEDKKNLFIKITEKGVSYDKKEALINVKQKFIKEKNTFKALLKDEFGLFKNDTAKYVENKKPKNKLSFKLDEDSVSTKTEKQKTISKKGKKQRLEWKDE